MTLVVSDISRHGIVMVGDSAVTSATGVEDGAVKIQYAEAANIGFALWGDAQVDGTYMDHWLAEFIKNQVLVRESVENVGQKLAAGLNSLLGRSGRSWSEMARGIHLAGYRNGLPVLFHVHCGHANEAAHELRLYHDYPDDQKLSEAQFQNFLNQPDVFVHLRNGYHRHFGPLFANILTYSAQMKVLLNIDFPRHCLEGRLDFYKTLVRFVAGVLAASGEDPGVNDRLSSIAFDSRGIVKNEILPFSASTPISGTFSRF
jgi:hypothetical protein